MPAAEPFVFHGCVQVCELLPRQVHDARELLEQIKHVPAESIFCHTSVLVVHWPPQPDAYPNDFAMWAAIELRDRWLTERLDAIDPFRFLKYHLVPVPTGHQVRTFPEFRDALTGAEQVVAEAMLARLHARCASNATSTPDIGMRAGLTPWPTSC